MPTDNPKISLYVPQQIYDRFKEFQEEQKLSMSQAGIVILAEYFGLKETIKEITEGTTIGGVTLERINELEQRLQKLEVQLSDSVSFELALLHEKIEHIRKSGETTKEVNVEYYSVEEDEIIDETKPLEKDDKTTDKLPIPSINPQLELLSEPLQEINPFTAKLLGIRFGIGKTAVSVYKGKNSAQKFQEWTKGKDPDGITWIPNPEGKGYIPKDELPSELKNKLLEWIEKNN